MVDQSATTDSRTRVVLDADTGGYAGRIAAKQQHSGGETTTGALPMWIDREGKLRIAVRLREPQFAGDFDQIIVDPADLFLGLATAFERKP